MSKVISTMQVLLVFGFAILLFSLIFGVNISNMLSPVFDLSISDNADNLISVFKGVVLLGNY